MSLRNFGFGHATWFLLDFVIQFAVLICCDGGLGGVASSCVSTSLIVFSSFCLLFLFCSLACAFVDHLGSFIGCCFLLALVSLPLASFHALQAFCILGRNMRQKLSCCLPGSAKELPPVHPVTYDSAGSIGPTRPAPNMSRGRSTSREMDDLMAFPSELGKPPNVWNN